MLITRRKMLASGSVVAAGAALAACTTNPTTGQLEFSPAVIDAIQQGVATAAKFIPLVESIVQQAVAMFGPAYATIVSIGSTAINSLISAIASIVGNLSPPAAAALHQRLRGSSPTQAVVIGVTPQNVTIQGYR